MSKYQIIRSMDDDNIAAILNDEDGTWFKEYDFMGSVEWTEKIAEANWMPIDAARDTVKDLKASDEPMAKDGPEKIAVKIVINTDDLMASLKTFLENIGCTNIQVSPMTGKEIESIRKNAVEL